MRYFGGKARLGKKIAEIINPFLNNGKDYIEPFVGGAWVTQHITDNCNSKICYDINPCLIKFWKDLIKNFHPPKSLTRDEYKYIKNNKEENMALTGFVGFGCSFAGKWFGGYASSKDRNYCLNAYNSVMKKKPLLMGCNFVCADYRTLKLENAVVYCDPPYANTTKYDYCPNFNSEEFWNIMRKWSRSNTVIISEYEAPKDFKCIAEFSTKTDIRNRNNQKEIRVEKLFKLDNSNKYGILY